MAGGEIGLADVVLILHFAFVLFVVGGLVAIALGPRLGWAFVDGLGFRIAHLLAIGVVVAESWLGIVCPLTSLEQALRARAGEVGPDPARGFVAHWVTRLLFYDLPPACFTIAYSAFGVAVLLAWWRRPPRRRSARLPGLRTQDRR